MKIRKPKMPKVKMNMVVGKRQIVLAALVMGLGCAVYLNWEYTKLDTDLGTTQVLETGKNYGDAQFVDSSEGEDAYFAEAKLSRTKSRDEAADALSEMLADAQSGSGPEGGTGHEGCRTFQIHRDRREDRKPHQGEGV